MKCIHCGKNLFKSKLTICKDCNIKIQAKKEIIVLCPNDKSQMEKKLIWNVVLDQCPVCGGIWIERGELEVVKKAIAEGCEDKYLEALSIGLSIQK